MAWVLAVLLAGVEGWMPPEVRARLIAGENIAREAAECWSCEIWFRGLGCDVREVLDSTVYEYRARYGQETCETVEGACMVTRNRSRKVSLCGEFCVRDRPPRAIAEMLLHEAAHSCGLGEHPPEPEDISRVVRVACLQC